MEDSPHEEPRYEQTEDETCCFRPLGQIISNPAVGFSDCIHLLLTLDAVDL